MNRWADLHAPELRAELEDGEQLMVAARVAVAHRRGGASTFPIPGRVFILGLSERRLLFWRASRWVGHPGSLTTGVSLDQVTSLELVRRLGPRRLRLTLASGSFLVLEPTWGGSIRALRDTFQVLRSC